MKLPLAAMSLSSALGLRAAPQHSRHAAAVAPVSGSRSPLAVALRAEKDDGDRKREIPEQPEYDVEGFGLKQLKEGDPATLVLAGFALILFNFTVLTAATGGGL